MAGIRLTEAVISPNEIDTCIQGRFIVALGIAHIHSIGDVVIFHQNPDSLALMRSGITVAQIAFDQMRYTQLLCRQLGITLLSVADDKQTMLLCQLFHCGQDVRIGNGIAGMLLQKGILDAMQRSISA